MTRHAMIPQQRGAALLMAMLIVALVATLSTAAMWQQWRNIALETADRQTSQAHWLLNGAMGWARVILREDANASQNGDHSDNLQEPWSIPLQETKLSTFVASLPDAATAVDQDPLAEKVVLSGQITDLQGRLNFMSLVSEGKINPSVFKSFVRLFTLLGLPPESLQTIAQQLITAQQSTSTGALLPLHFAQLSWLGLTHAQLQTLKPYATLLPQPTALNVNTASAQTLYAALAGLSLAQAQGLVQQRQTAHWSTVDAFIKASGVTSAQTDLSLIAVQTQYFEVQGHLRIDDQHWDQRCVLWRNNTNVQTLWCENGQWALL